MVAPSGPGLSTIDKEVKYWEALRGADCAIPDSSLMIILARCFFRMNIKKLSGPKFLRLFVKEDILKNEGMLFSIDPSPEALKINNQYLNRIGIRINKDNHYVAPYYNKSNIEDVNLLSILESLKVK